MVDFESLGLDADLVSTISYLGFTTPTPIQEATIPFVLQGNDVLGCAQTGTGKTGAFVLPLLSRIKSQQDRKGVQALILSPTRELAIQIDRQIEGMAYGLDISSMAIYGGGKGEDWSQEKHAMDHGLDIVVATPGKLISHLATNPKIFNSLKYFVLDEADRMLDMGFYDDVLKICSFLPETRQNLMFSATMPESILQMAQNILNDHKEVRLAVSKPAEGVLQVSYLCQDRQKIPLLVSLLKDKDYCSSIVVFASTKKSVGEIVQSLRKDGLNAKSISSNLEQSQREEVLQEFKSKKLRILVATDVISRGIDIKDINLVVNYNVPNDAEDYVHRVGRTARANTTGLAITFISPRDMFSFSKIESLIEMDIMKLPPPVALGAGPVWDPKGRPSGGFKGKRDFKKRY